MAQSVKKRMKFYFDENVRNQLNKPKLELVSAIYGIKTAFDPIVSGSFEYSTRNAKIHYSAQNISVFSNLANRSTT
jgi:hypothetical protein